MIIGVPRETSADEARVALVPDGVKTLVGEGVEVRLERGAGERAGFDDAAYEAAGAQLESDTAALWAAADLLLKVAPPGAAGAGHELDGLRKGAALVSLLRPLDDLALGKRLAECGATAFALELMPRITRAQSMDVLSSQATVAGYRASLIAAFQLPKMFPMMVTAAGTISPARVFIIGAGVAGLQAIATTKRLGAVVEAYDTRPAVAEQVESLGAKFVDVELDTGDAEDKGGYAREQTEEFYEQQRRFMTERAIAADVVITTALVPGRPAPQLITEEAVQGMKRGSIIVDLAAPNGGNCACTVPGETVEVHGVTIVGQTNLAGEIPGDASHMYSKNAVTFIRHLLNEGELVIDLEDEITSGAMLTHAGQVTNAMVAERLGGGSED